MPNSTQPRIGQVWPTQGGIYAGIMAGQDGQPDYHLILAPKETEIESIAWGKYGTKIAGAASYFDGKANTADMAAADLDLGKQITGVTADDHTDYYLPSQAEMHLLAANLKNQFDQDDWYWTSTQYSATLAWQQGFGYGNQYYSYMDAEVKARAVRMIPISS